ncbi:MAG TPA: hypothetical protein VGO38_13300 [Acidimicrobiia bacterium]
MTPEDMKLVWTSHCTYEFELRDVQGALSPPHRPAFAVDTATRLRDLPPS